MTSRSVRKKLSCIRHVVELHAAMPRRGDLDDLVAARAVPTSARRRGTTRRSRPSSRGTRRAAVGATCRGEPATRYTPSCTRSSRPCASRCSIWRGGAELAQLVAGDDVVLRARRARAAADRSRPEPGRRVGPAPASGALPSHGSSIIHAAEPAAPLRHQPMRL